MKLEAVCPCITGCDQCQSGRITVTIPDGPEYRYYTRHCHACDYRNGGRITGPDLPPLPERPESPCVQCGSEDIHWEVW